MCFCCDAYAFFLAVFLCRLRPGYIIQAIVYDNRVTNFNSIEHFFCFCVRCIHTSVGSVRQIDVTAVLGTPARIVDSDVAVKRKPEHDMARIELEITVTFLRIHRPDTACRSVIARRMIARCDRCFRHQNAVLVAPHFLLGNAHLDVCISDIICRAVIGRIEVNRVEISLCFVLDRLQKCLRRLLLVDAPAVIAARIQVMVAPRLVLKVCANPKVSVSYAIWRTKAAASSCEIV